MSKDQDRKQPTPMDPNIREVGTAAPTTNNQRVCLAAKTLVAEFLALFPETPVEYSNYDGRNTALDVAFDLTGADDPEQAAEILGLTTSDHRVETAITETSVDSTLSTLLVSFKANPRSQDSREPFGLAQAYDVLSGGSL